MHKNDYAYDIIPESINLFRRLKLPKIDNEIEFFQSENSMKQKKCKTLI